jgi:hypothetical protein
VINRKNGEEPATPKSLWPNPQIRSQRQLSQLERRSANELGEREEMRSTIVFLQILQLHYNHCDAKHRVQPLPPLMQNPS